MTNNASYKSNKTLDQVIGLHSNETTLKEVNLVKKMLEKHRVDDTQMTHWIAQVKKEESIIHKLEKKEKGGPSHGDGVCRGDRHSSHFPLEHKNS